MLKFFTKFSKKFSKNFLGISFYVFSFFSSVNIKTFIFSFIKFFLFLIVFAREWLYTTNHKKLGLNYLFASFFSGLFGTFLSTLIRIELSQPGSLLFSGNANAYHVVVGIHAILMVFFLVTPAVFGGIGNYFLPIHTGARDVAYPRLNNFSLWLLPAGLITALRALWEGIRTSSLNFFTESNYSFNEWERDLFGNNIFIAYGDLNNYNFNEYSFDSEAQSWILLSNTKTDGNFLLYIDCNYLPANKDSLAPFLPSININVDLTNTMAGWTFTTPFSHSRFTGVPVDWALAALLIATLSSIITIINLIVTWRYLRGRGSRNQKEFFPISLISIFISLRILIVVSPILNAGLIMLISDRHFYTSFFTVRAGGDILLFQHIFWFFGHPEVYVLILPGFGIASTLIPYYVRKPLGSKMHMIYAMHAIASMGFVVWGHHMYLVGIDNKARILFFVVTIMIALPASVKVCGWMASLVNSTTFLSSELLFAIIFVGFFIIGGVTGSFCAHAATDIMLHDTYYIVGHFHIMLSGALMAALFSYIYFNIREFTGVYYNWFFVFLHLVCHTIGHVLTFLPMLWLGFAGMPRRIQDYPWGYAGWHSVASLGHTIVLFSIFSFIISMLLILYLKTPAESKNKGFPFVTTRLGFLTMDKSYLYNNKFKKNLVGKDFIRNYMKNRAIRSVNS